MNQQTGGFIAFIRRMRRPLQGLSSSPTWTGLLLLSVLLCAAPAVWAGWGWKALPNDEEIHSAALAAIPSRPVESWTTSKRHDAAQPVQNPLWVNHVILVWLEANPHHRTCDPNDPDCTPDAKYWCGHSELAYENGWAFDLGEPLYGVDDLGTCLGFIAYAPGWIGVDNRAPTVTLTYTPANPAPEDTVEFFADASDPDGDSLTYEWYLEGEKQNATMPNVNWSNPPAGTYTLKVVVSDGNDGIAVDSVTFTVGSGAGAPPCSIRYFTLYPQSSIAGPIVDPGQYMVWTAQVIRTPNPPTAGLQWKSTGPYEFKAGHRYVVTMNDNTKTSGAVSVDRSDVGGSSSTVYYANDASSTEYAVTVCPATTPPPGGGALAAAIDADNDGKIDDPEIVDAIRLWISGATVPGAGQTISDAEILSLIQMWIMGQPVSASSARQSHPAPMVSQPLKVERAVLLPMHGGALTLEIVGAGVAGVELEVFDLSGRRVFQAREMGPRLRFDALDAVGLPLANGVYLYVIMARGAHGSTWRSKIEKLVILR